MDDKRSEIMGDLIVNQNNPMYGNPIVDGSKGITIF